jgi:hypothetical protein
MIGTHHKQAVVILLCARSGYAVLTKVKNKTSERVDSTIMTKLMLLAHPLKL